VTDTLVIPADLELFLCGYLRDQCAALATQYPVLADFEFTNHEPEVDAADFPAKLGVIRDDSGDWLSVVSQERAIGVSVLMKDPLHASQAARLLVAIVRNCAKVAPGNPVAAVTQSNGPYSVQEDQPRTRLYATHTLIVVGEGL
jgi:hypothetical protein